MKYLGIVTVFLMLTSIFQYVFLQILIEVYDLNIVLYVFAAITAAFSTVCVYKNRPKYMDEAEGVLRSLLIKFDEGIASIETEKRADNEQP